MLFILNFMKCSSICGFSRDNYSSYKNTHFEIDCNCTGWIFHSWYRYCYFVFLCLRLEIMLDKSSKGHSKWFTYLIEIRGSQDHVHRIITIYDTVQLSRIKITSPLYSQGFNFTLKYGSCTLWMPMLKCLFYPSKMCPFIIEWYLYQCTTLT